MPEKQYEQTRVGVGRRLEDYQAYESRLDAIDNDVQKQAGWMKATGLITIVLVAVLLPISSWFLGSMLSTLKSIESLLNSNNITLQLHTEQIKNAQIDIKELQEHQNNAVDTLGHRPSTRR